MTARRSALYDTQRMSLPDHDPISLEIQELLRQPLPPVVQEFAFIHLSTYREEALEAARSPALRPTREERVAAARLRLRDKLRSLLAWARDAEAM